MTQPVEPVDFPYTPGWAASDVLRAINEHDNELRQQHADSLRRFTQNREALQAIRDTLQQFCDELLLKFVGTRFYTSKAVVYFDNMELTFEWECRGQHAKVSFRPEVNGEFLYSTRNVYNGKWLPLPGDTLSKIAERALLIAQQTVIHGTRT